MGSARLLIALDVQLCVQPDGRLDVRDRRADPMYYFIRATVPHVQSTIALYTELYVKCDQQSRGSHVLFYPRDATLALVLAVAVCLCVCVRVLHTPVLCQNGCTDVFAYRLPSSLKPPLFGCTCLCCVHCT